MQQNMQKSEIMWEIMHYRSRFNKRMTTWYLALGLLAKT